MSHKSFLSASTRKYNEVFAKPLRQIFTYSARKPEQASSSSNLRVGGLSRRRFLQTSAITAAASGLFSPQTFAQNRVPANDRITLGFIGMGKQNQHHLPAFLRRSDTQVLAVCDVDTTRRQDARKQVEKFYAEHSRSGTFKGCEDYNDFQKLIHRKDIDAVVISTPDHWHAIPVIMAANAGKDIYCEKPLSLTIHEAKAMVDAVRKNQCVFQTGSQQRSSGNFRFACEMVQSGRIGKIRRVEVAVGGPSHWCDLNESQPPKGLDWDLWLGPAPFRGWNEILSPVGVHDHYPRWRSFREYSGGGMTDWGAHHFDIAQWGLGMDESSPAEIIPPEKENAETGVRFVYANGVEMEHVSGNGVTFYGTEGKIFVNRGKLETTPASLAETPTRPDEVHLYESNNHHANWMECIRSRKKPICDVEIGARSVTVCHLGNLAYWYNRRLKWNPAQWHFVDDAEANTRWMDVHRREPWTLPV